MMKSCKRSCRSIVVGTIAIIAICFSGAALEATTIYLNVADGNWTNSASWNPAQVPGSADEVRIQNGGTLHINSDVSCLRLYVGSSTSTTGHLEMASGTLTVGDNFSVGRNGYGTFVQSGGDIVCKDQRIGVAGYGEYTMNGGSLTVTNSMYIGDAGTGRFYQTAGTTAVTNGSAFMRIGSSSGSNGRYELSGGTASVYVFIGTSGYGYLKQSGGSLYATHFSMADNATSTGTYECVGGELIVANNNPSVCDMGSGTFLFGDANSAGTFVETNGAKRLVVGSTRTNSEAKGIFRGWGVIGLTQRLLFYPNGSIIADGYGVDRDLDFSNMDGTWSVYTNAAGQAGGVYAQNHGRLVYKAHNVVTYTYYYGESNDYKTTNVINSAVVDINMKSGGSILHVALLASDRDDVAPDIRTIGTWEFSFDNPTQLNSATLSFRYDDSLVPSLGIPESELLILRRNGNDWDDVTGSIDTVRHIITTTSLTDINSQFVVGLPPLPKGTVISVK